MGVALPERSLARKKRVVVAVAEIEDDGDLASLRQHLPNAVWLELRQGPAGLHISANRIAKALVEAEDLASCVEPNGGPLPPRQQQILALIIEGRTNKDIGRILSLSPFTVRNHISLLFRLLNVRTRAEAAVVASQLAYKRPECTAT
ncbi:helix-turn-helix transcriptional regulator [Labrys neptuniae]